jgi:hypothetical protein
MVVEDLLEDAVVAGICHPGLLCKDGFASRQYHGFFTLAQVIFLHREWSMRRCPAGFAPAAADPETFSEPLYINFNA